jgi:hypothetical protein
VTSDGSEKTRSLALFRIAAQALCGLALVRSWPFQRIKALEQRLPALEGAGDNVFVQYLLEKVMHWHLVLFVALFVESQPTAGAIVIVIIDPEFQKP